jgi:hypothetical protein
MVMAVKWILTHFDIPIGDGEADDKEKAMHQAVSVAQSHAVSIGLDIRNFDWALGGRYNVKLETTHDLIEVFRDLNSLSKTRQH